ncbi:discoidin domain-containing protein [bacterium]|nr:discoidin domain-containing protein [bacterium]
MKRSPALVCIVSMVCSGLFAQAPVIRIACVGNSITYGGLGSDSYPQQLGALLGSHYEVRNYGIGGTTLLRNGDFPYWNEEALLRAKEYDAHIVIILLGTNDSKPQNWIYRDDFFSDYLTFIGEFRTGGHDPQIYVGNPPPVFQEGLDINAQIIREEIVPMMDSIRTAGRAFPIDFYNTMLDQGDHFPDAIHPDAAGYGVMAQTARDAILAGPAGKIRSFTVRPDVVEQGMWAELYWETTPGSDVMLDGIPVAETDSTTVFANEETVFTLTASGDVLDTSQVTLQYLAPGTIKLFTAVPAVLDQGSGASSELMWQTSSGSVAFLDGKPVGASGSKTVTPLVSTTYTLTAGGTNADTSLFTVQVLPSDSINRALNHPITASSTERGFLPESAVDGDTVTCWQSAGINTEWINVDLGQVFEINRIVIDWGDRYATLYHLQGMDEENNIVTLYSEAGGDGGLDDIRGLSGRARYIRLLCITNNGTGCAVHEFGVYYTPGQSPVTNTGDLLAVSPVLLPNYPNPFNPGTCIRYSLPERTHVALIVTDLLGREIVRLDSGWKSGGHHRVEFDGSRLASGMYLVVLKTERTCRKQKMLLIK